MCNVVFKEERSVFDSVDCRVMFLVSTDTWPFLYMMYFLLRKLILFYLCDGDELGFSFVFAILIFHPLGIILAAKEP